MKINIKKFIFSLAFFIKIVISFGQKIPVIAQTSNYLNYLILILLLFLFIIQSKDYKLKSLIIILLSFVTIFISAYICKDVTLLQLLLFILCFKDIEFESFLKYSLIIKVFIFFLIISLWKFGLIEETVTYRIDKDVVRHSIGFAHPNGLGVSLLSICCDLIFLHYKKIKILDLFVLLISFLVAVFVCDSRAVQIGIIVLVLCTYLLPKLKKNILFKKSITYLPIILLIISLLLTLIYPLRYSWMEGVDKAFSGRIFLAHSFFNYYGIHFFGNYFQFYGNPNGAPWFYALDNGYMHLLIKFGLLPTILIIILLIKSIKYFFKNNNFQALSYLITFLVYGLMEIYVSSFQFNTILLYCGSYIYLKNKYNGEKKLIKK